MTPPAQVRSIDLPLYEGDIPVVVANLFAQQYSLNAEGEDSVGKAIISTFQNYTKVMTEKAEETPEAKKEREIREGNAAAAAALGGQLG